MIGQIGLQPLISTTPSPRRGLSEDKAGVLPSDQLVVGQTPESFSRPQFSVAAVSETPQVTTSEPVPAAATAPVVISDADRLIQPGTVVWELQPGWAHSKARTELGKDYPPRQLPPNGALGWNAVGADYQPVRYEAPVLAKQPAWADPPSVAETLAKRQLQSYEPQQFGPQGEPLNPKGPTGICGRGLLGKHGANFAADPIVTRINPETGKLEMIAIVREDLGQVAIPGGMVDHGEKISGTLARELAEETLGKDEHAQAGAQERKLQQMFERATPVYRGYVDDPRNTDNSWMETQVFHLHLTPAEAEELKLQKGSDAAQVDWKPITAESLAQMYASHGAFVKQAVLLWQQETGQVLGRDGQVGIPPG